MGSMHMHADRKELAHAKFFLYINLGPKGNPRNFESVQTYTFSPNPLHNVDELSEWCWYRCFVLLMILLISSISIKLAKYVHFNTCIYFFQIATNKLSNLPRTTQILKIRKFSKFFSCQYSYNKSMNTCEHLIE